MADVKWIKITTDIFDDEKILLIESLPDAYAIITVWFKLLCLAGKMNNSGVFMMNNSIAYTDKMLSTIFRMKETTVQLALDTFEQFGMIDRIDGVITIPNWDKHQNLDAIEKKREYQKEWIKQKREKQRNMCRIDSKVDSRFDVDSLEEDIEEDKEKDNKNNVSPKQVCDLFNSICHSYPSIRSISEARKKAINARLKVYTLDDFRTLFNKAEASSFLKGSNSKNWSATFDWLIKDSNMAKVIDGNYDNRNGTRKNSFNNFEQNEYDFDELEKSLLAN